MRLAVVGISAHVALPENICVYVMPRVGVHIPYSGYRRSRGLVGFGTKYIADEHALPLGEPEGRISPDGQVAFHSAPNSP